MFVLVMVMVVMDNLNTLAGSYAGFFFQGGKQAEGPYIFKYEATFILPYIFKVKQNCKFNFLWGRGQLPLLPPPSVYGPVL